MSATAQAPIVLAYHAIHATQAGVEAPDVITRPEVLSAHVESLLRAGRRVLTAGELLDEVRDERPPDGVAVLTFDDGWLDGLTVAAPLLAALGVRATFFVCPGLWEGFDSRMGEAGKVMSREQARQLVEAGMELGSHSLSHADLRELDDHALAAELEGSRASVEAITEEPCRTFAYPFGLHDTRVAGAVREAGFELAFAFRPGPWRRYAVPRLPAPPGKLAGIGT